MCQQLDGAFLKCRAKCLQTIINTLVYFVYLKKKWVFDHDPKYLGHCRNVLHCKGILFSVLNLLYPTKEEIFCPKLQLHLHPHNASFILSILKRQGEHSSFLPLCSFLELARATIRYLSHTFIRPLSIISSTILSLRGHFLQTRNKFILSHALNIHPWPCITHILPPSNLLNLH